MVTKLVAISCAARPWELSVGLVGLSMPVQQSSGLEVPTGLEQNCKLGGDLVALQLLYSCPEDEIEGEVVVATLTLGVMEASRKQVSFLVGRFHAGLAERMVSDEAVVVVSRNCRHAWDPGIRGKVVLILVKEAMHNPVQENTRMGPFERDGFHDGAAACMVLVALVIVLRLGLAHHERSIRDTCP